ncbi:MAG: DUF6876 family protein [Dehalococcoidia bacterium]
MTRSLTPDELREQLRQFTGGDCFYRHPLNRQVIYTEGVRFLAEHAKAYWLIDAIASYFPSPVMEDAIGADERLASLQFWTLNVAGDQAELLMLADRDERPLIRQRIALTDFPLDRIDIWAGFNGSGWTLYLPSEH